MDSKFIIFVTIGLSFCQGLKYESAVEPTAQKEEFTCPEEFGYFPHPSDCSQYYVCVFGGALLESCTGGLMYSHELQTCDWPRNVNQFYCNSSVPLPTNNLDNSASNLNHRVNNNNNNNGGRIRGRISTTTESQYVYKPIKIENYGDLTQVIQSNSNNQQESNNGRNSRSYEQAVPNFKQDNYAKNIPYGRSVSSGGSLKGKYEYESAQPEYGNQRYAAHVPANNSASYVYQQQPNSQPNSQAQTEDENDSSYYVYDDSQQSQFDDDVDYKTYGSNYQQAIPATTTTTTTRRPTTTYAPAPVKQRTRGGSSSSSSSGSSRSSRPTLKPKGSKVKDSAPVRDVYLDAPSRPAPYYETPVSNTPASKCKKDTCVLPDCYCGGKDIPAGLAPEQTPQMVLLTFDDSVNDLNKNLYRDLFEKGRKNPNGCPISATFYVSHEWTDYSQVQNLAADGHEIASHSVSHSFGEAFSQKKWEKEINGQREILAAYGGVKLSDVRGMRAPFLAIGGNNMFKMLHDANFTYDSSMPVYENRPPSWPYTLDYKIFHDCMIPPCPTKSYPGVWEVPMVMWQDLKGGRCSMGDACSNPPTAEGVYQMLAKNFERHYTTNRAPFGLYYHAAWFTQAHHKEGFEAFLDTLVQMDDVWLVTNYQALQWIRNPTPNNRINSFAPFNTCHDNRPDVRPARCNHPRVCNLWHKSGVRYMKTCQTCPQQYPWTGNTGVPFTI